MGIVVVVTKGVTSLVKDKLESIGGFVLFWIVLSSRLAKKGCLAIELC